MWEEPSDKPELLCSSAGLCQTSDEDDKEKADRVDGRGEGRERKERSAGQV